MEHGEIGNARGFVRDSFLPTRRSNGHTEGKEKSGKVSWNYLLCEKILHQLRCLLGFFDVNAVTGAWDDF
jgi:hypothetical protein